MKSSAKSVDEYLATLPPERREVVAAVRKVIRKHLPKGYAESLNWGMLAYEVPLARYPDTYNKQPLLYAALAAQKNNYSLYLMGVYGVPALEKKLRAAFAAAGKKLDMGKSCVRFKSAEDLPLEAIGELIAALSVDAYVEHARSARAPSKSEAAKKPAAKANSARGAKARPAK